MFAAFNFFRLTDIFRVPIEITAGGQSFDGGLTDDAEEFILTDDAGTYYLTVDE